MQVLVLGLNNKTASIETREKLFVPADKQGDAYNTLLETTSIQGAVMLSTCNRVEYYCTVETTDTALNELIDFLCQWHQIPKSDFVNSLYIKKENYAIEHLFKVISSIDSMVIGEDQIQGQIREAYIYAFEHSYTNSLLNKLFQSAIQLGKRIRTETQINHGSVSIGSIATELILEKFPTSPKVLVIGAGDIADLTLTNLTAKMEAELHVTNRSPKRARDLAAKHKAQIIDFQSKEQHFGEYDVIVASTSAKEYIISPKQTGHIARPQLYIDLCVPRNIAPEIQQNPQLRLHSIEDFDAQLTANKLIREEAIAAVKHIIREEADNFYEWYATQTIIPAMKSIKSELNELSSRTINEYNSFLNTLEKSQREKVKSMLLTSDDKLIRLLMKNLKNMSQDVDLKHVTNTLKEVIRS